ncbi:hypothetical protein K466DRAFT_345702 [Polyporus arcularius HHB13444]|uniref:Uncharacterized protein n=1 Tax=Polyporus arcularius HHB13444 TaxID=1314778 RepID=A0A5C3PR85_9APHY|nr:hypothetical protein K466DRAFT_345702 [Polyporus arcularius HHB13444]
MSHASSPDHPVLARASSPAIGRCVPATERLTSEFSVELCRSGVWRLRRRLAALLTLSVTGRSGRRVDTKRVGTRELTVVCGHASSISLLTSSLPHCRFFQTSLQYPGEQGALDRHGRSSAVAKVFLETRSNGCDRICAET